MWLRFRKASSSVCCFALLVVSHPSASQELKSSLEYNKQTAFTIFSGRSNKLAGYANGGYLAYHMNIRESAEVKRLAISSIAIALDYKDLRKVHRIETSNFEPFNRSYSLTAAPAFSLIDFKGLRLIFSPGLGFCYVNEKGYPDKHPILRSPINFASTAALKLIYKIAPDAHFVSGADIVHVSNAATRVPNNGLNIVGFNMGIVKYFATRKMKQLHFLSNDVDSAFAKHYFEVGFLAGVRGMYYSKKWLYRSSVYAGYIYHFASYLGLTTGLDGVYYYSVFDVDNYSSTYQSKASSFARWRLGAEIGPSLYMGRLTIKPTYGRYLYYKSYLPIRAYWTMGFAYRVSSWAAIKAKLYVHEEEVDFLGLGFEFNWSL